MNRKVLCYILLLGLFSCAVSRQTPGPVYDITEDEELLTDDSLRSLYSYIEGIKRYLIFDDDKGAAEHLAESARLDSTERGAFHFQAAMLQMRSENPDSAAWHIRQAYSSDTTNLTYLQQLGQILVYGGRYPEAQKVFEKILRLTPPNAENYRVLAALYSANSQPFAAINLLDSAEVRLGRNLELSAMRRELLMMVNLNDRALKEAEALAQEEPYDIDNHIVLAELYGAQNRDSLAQNSYRKAMQMDSTNLRLLTSMLGYYRAGNRNMEFLSTARRMMAAPSIPLETKLRLFTDVTSSTQYYQTNYFAINAMAESLIARYPTDRQAVELYTTHLIKSGELEKAIEIEKSYALSVSDNLDALTDIISMESYLQRQDSVAKYTDIAIRQYPDNCSLYISKAYSEHSMGNDKESLRTFKKALKCAETDSVRSVIYSTEGDIMHAAGRKGAGYRLYEKALRLDSLNSSLLNNYAYALCEDGVFDQKTLRMSETACRLSENNSTYLDTWAWILYRMGRLDEAKKIMQQAISFDTSEDSTLYLHYGDILYEMGNLFLAEHYWKQAQQKGYDQEEIRKRLEKIEKP